MKIIHHEKLLRLILSDSHSSTFSELINQWLLWKLWHALRKLEDRDKKNKKAAFAVAWMKFLLTFQAQKTTQDRIIVERFSSSAPSTTTFTPETVHAVISVIHEKVYDIIQIEVNRKKLESSTSVASSSSKAVTRSERKETRYFIDLVAPRQMANRVIKPRKQTLTLDGKKGRANLSERKMKARTVHFKGLKNER